MELKRLDLERSGQVD